jgi:cell division transport system permease protein
MKILDLRRIIKAGFINFKRSSFVSLSSVLVMTITLSVVTLLIFSQAVLNFSLEGIKDKVDVTVYTTLDASEPDILNLQKSIEELPTVASVTYISADQALENFKAKHSNDFLTLQALQELDGNPLGATLNIKAVDTADYETIAKFLDNKDTIGNGQKVIIDKVNYSQNKLVIDKLISITEGARKLGIAVTIVLMIISLIITFNTIRLVIYISRDEISVMRLVGAENHYIRGPFLVEGMLYGIVSAIITMILFYPMTLWAGANMTSFLGINLHTYYIANFFQLLVICAVFGMILGIVSSFFAVRAYLKK